MQKTYKNIGFTVKVYSRFKLFVPEHMTLSEGLEWMIDFFEVNHITPFGREVLSSRLVLERLDRLEEKLAGRVDAGIAISRSIEKGNSERLGEIAAMVNQIGVEFGAMKGVEKLVGNYTYADMERIVSSLHDAEEQNEFLRRELEKVRSACSDTVGYGQTVRDLCNRVEDFLCSDRNKEEGKAIWRFTRLQITDFLKNLRERAGIRD